MWSIAYLNEDGGAHFCWARPASRSLYLARTIQDLLRHTSGFAYDLFGTSLVTKAYQAASIRDPNQTLAEFASKLAELPLAHQSGTTWNTAFQRMCLEEWSRSYLRVIRPISFEQNI
jgi:CubicO group peptidase (beta-lactamase class C family)